MHGGYFTVLPKPTHPFPENKSRHASSSSSSFLLSKAPKVLSFLFSSNYHLFFLSSLLRVISALNSAAQPLIVDLIRSSN